MKVYILIIEYDYDGFEILSIHSTPELAEKRKAFLYKQGYYQKTSGSRLSFEEFTVDEEFIR